MNPRPIVFLVLGIALLGGGCTPKPPVSSPGSAAPSTPSAPGATPTPTPAVPVPQTAPPAKPVPGVVPAPVPKVVRPFDESLVRGREFLLESAGERRFVRDPDLGALGRNPAVIRACETFFQGALGGKLDPATLVPRWAGYLQAWAKRFQAGAGEGRTVRVGEEIPGEDGLLLVPVRLAGGAKPALQGWVALAKEGETWLVSDVQIVESVSRTDPFDPESPSQEISSPSLR